MASIQIADNDARVQYTQAVTANSTSLTIDFPFFDLDDINVIVTTSAGVDTTLTRGTGTGTFAVTGTAVDDGFSGGSITLGDSYSNTHTYTIFRDIEASRTTDFATSGPFNISSLNTELDKIYAIIQQIETENNRALTLPQSDATASITLPTKSSRLGKYLAFHETTGLATVGGDVADTGTVAAQSANISTLAGINANITTVAGIQANVTTVAGISSNVTTVAGISANVTTLATGTTGGNSNKTNINTVAGAVSNINTVASSISDINTLAASDVITDMSMLAVSDVISDMNTLANADVIADMNTLATSDIISDLNTLATSDIVTDMNLLATSDNVTAMGHLGTSANVTAMGLLGTSAVVEDMGFLGTSANVTAMANLGTSTNVTNMTNLNASGVISNIATVAGSVSNVNTVATNISGVNSFADRYRVASSAPTSSLDVGDLYFDTTANELKVYKSSGWSAAGSTVNGTSARFHYNISGTPTTVTGADANGNTLAYDAGFADVYVNGVRMSPDDITITSGTSVVFASALADGDDVDIVAFGTFNVANIVSTGALNSGSITSGFGNIDTGSSTITTTGAISGGTLTGSTSIKTPLIEFTDGDNALTIADGGHVTANANLGVTGTSTLTGGIANFTLITGGAVQDYESGGTNYRSHSFLTAGTHRFSTSTAITIDFLIVAGGGGSAGAEGQHGSTGGGGAGGLVEATSQTLTAGNYTIVVGAGGAKSTNVSAPASNGGNSTFNGFTATGGAGGGDYEGGTRNGGSGAGGSEDGESGGGTTQDTYSGTTNVTGYGNVGGNGGSYPSGGSGSGGGAGGAGGTANGGTVTGGAGRANNFRTGSNVTYSTGGVGVSGDNIVGVAGSPNTGDGAGGVSTSSGNNTAGEDGGSGIVVIRYAL